MRLKLLFTDSFQLVAIVMLVLLGTSVASAQTSSFTYQGRLTDGGTAAIGNYDLQFALWDSISGGSQIGSTQTLNTVAVSNGVFSVTLDFGANSFTGANRFLEISARLSGAGSFTLLTPRQQVTATPYAIRSVNASSADALSGSCSGCVADANISGMAGSKVTGTIPASAVPAGSGNYIQNTSAAQSGTFNISGNGTAAGTLSGNIVNATTRYSLGGNGILSNAGTNNLFAGVGSGQGNTAGSNNAFFGAGAGSRNATGGSNTIIGASANVLFNNLTNATAVGANAQVDTSNSLVLGGISGVNGASASTNVGIGTTSPTASLRVETNTAGGTLASFGQNGDFQIDAVNVPGGRLLVKENGNVGIGTTNLTARDSRLTVRAAALISGFAGQTGIFGVGGSKSTINLQQDGGPGVVAVGGDASNGGFSGEGLIAQAGVADVPSGSQTGLAGRFNGNVSIVGTLDVFGTKNFLIDHPLDPENKYLRHAAIESSEVLNVYSGNVTLGPDGVAVVTLPDWFGVLNRDFRYQLTAIGAPAQGLYIAEEINQNRFRIAGGVAGMKVSWQVTGVRSDAAMLKHPFKVEEDKPERERGTYLTPEAFGQPEEMGMMWARHPELMRRMKETRLKQIEELKGKGQSNNQ